MEHLPKHPNKQKNKNTPNLQPNPPPNINHQLTTDVPPCSGLGFSTCCRLVDEFLFSRPQTQKLHLIATTRDASKSHSTLSRLRTHLSATLRSANSRTAGISVLLEPRIQLSSEQLDLCDLVSVKRLGTRLVQRGQRIDVLVLNAGIGGWKGLDWGRAVWSIVTDWVTATTYPTYKLGWTGRTAPKQIVGRHGQGRKTVKGSKNDEHEDEDALEPRLGETFTANVFGHYLLAHWLVPVMRGSRDQSPGRVIWVSSLEAYAHCLDLDDLQGLATDASYESSKRLTDLLVLTSELPSTKPYVSGYLTADAQTGHVGSKEAEAEAKANVKAEAGQERDDDDDDTLPPKLFLAHPGICGTSIANLNPLLNLCMLFAFHISRLLGSPWHTISPYLGACSMVWLSLCPLTDLEIFEDSKRHKKAKWGSSADVFGRERVMLTEVGGWGWSGRVGEANDGKMKVAGGSWRGLERVTEESREGFEGLGRRAWAEMEGLRKEWEVRLADVGADEEGGEQEAL